MNPNSLIRAKVLMDEIRPMFGPSGVSMGQMRPLMRGMHVAYFKACAIT